MNAATAAALASKAAQLNVLYVLGSVCLIVGMFTFLATLGEKALGLDLRRMVDAIEARAAGGDVWPAVVAFFAIPSGLLGLVLWIGLR